MKIAISANSSWNLLNFRAGLIRALVAEGHEVVALTPSDPAAPDLAGLGCRHRAIAMRGAGLGPLGEARALASYLRAFRAERPDLYLGFTIKPNIYGALMARAHGARAVVNVSGLGTMFHSGTALQRGVEALYRLAFARCQRVFFQNRADRALFLERGLIAPAQAGLLPGSGVDCARFAPVPAPPAPPIRFLQIGRVLRDKGAAEFVEAARLLRARGVAAEFTLLGDLAAENRTAIAPERIARWRAEDVVALPGPAADVRPHIAAAHVVVLASWHEGAPRSLIEAQAMARPVIATDIPGCRAVIGEGVTGALVPVRDAPALAEAMARMAALNDEERAALGAAGRRRVEALFDESRVIGAYRREVEAAASAPRDDPDRMHDAGDIAQQGQQDVDPELRADTDLQKHAQRGEQDGENQADDIHEAASPVSWAPAHRRAGGV